MNKIFYETYLPYLESLDQESMCHWTKPKDDAPKCVYTSKFTRFIKALTESSLMDPNYLKTIESYNLHTKNYNKYIKEHYYEFDLKLAKAWLTFLIRVERVCVGSWTTAVEEKSFLLILTHIQALTR